MTACATTIDRFALSAAGDHQRLWSDYAALSGAARHSRWYCRGWAALTSVAVVLCGCIAVEPLHEPMTIVHVEIDLYSGRENPFWKLQSADAARFVTRLVALPPDNTSTSTSDAPERLGYRGLKVAVSSVGTTRQYVIARGTVASDYALPTGRHQFVDSGRALEKWLLQTGKEWLGDKLLEHLLSN